MSHKVIITVSMSPELLQKADQMAQQTGRSRSALFRDLVRTAKLTGNPEFTMEEGPQWNDNPQIKESR